MSIALYDDFSNPLGQFVNYATYDSGQQTQLAAQKHVNIRSFENATVTTGTTMFALDHYLTSQLDTDTMAQLESLTVISTGEGWSAGVVGAQADRNNFKGIALACTAGANTATSIISPIDISSFSGSDYISLSLPAFPLASITTASTFLDLSADPTGGFTAGQTTSLRFSQSTTTLTNGDCEARWLVSGLTFDLTQLRAVRFRVQATGNCSFRCLAIRAIAASWQFAPLDQNTLYGRLEATVPPTGSLTQPRTFPTASGPVTPSDWPIALFSDGSGGPNVVDLDVGVVLQTGAGTATNTVTLYLREAAFSALTMGSMRGQTMSALRGQHFKTPGVQGNFSQTHFLTVSLQWGATNALHIKDETGAGYDFTGLSLSNASSYYLSVTMRGNSLRAQIYPVNAIGFIDWATVVFDSTAVIDSSLVRRRRGRVGWYAQLNEGGTYLQALRPRRTVYGEYISTPFNSLTPVEGAQLYPTSSPDAELYGGAVALPGTRLSVDTAKSRSGHSLLVQCDGLVPYQGLSSAPIRFENFADSEVSFSIFTGFPGRMQCALMGENRIVSLPLPPLMLNRWTSVTITLDYLVQLMPGPYSLFVFQTGLGATSWYVDKLSVRTRNVAWAGRTNPASGWVKFGAEINDSSDGALLGRGHSLQIRGEAVRPDAAISGMQVLPRYAPLGNFAWADQEPVLDVPLAVSFTTGASALPHGCLFTGTASYTPPVIRLPNVRYDIAPLAYLWNYGDGTYGYGAVSNHQYAAPGNYTVVLVVIDNYNRKVPTAPQVITVS